MSIISKNLANSSIEVSKRSSKKSFNGSQMFFHPHQPQSGLEEHLLGNGVNFPHSTSLKTRSGVTKGEDWWKTPNPKTLCFSQETLITRLLKMLKTKIWGTWVAVQCNLVKFWKLLVLVWIKLTPVVVETFQIFSTQMSNQTTLNMTQNPW